MLRIAITGNIASGKSQVEKFIAKRFPVYDTDKIAHAILNNLTDFYGQDVFTNGHIDRKKLGNIVFNNPELKQELENIIHPQVKSKIMEIFENHKNEKAIFISVPLLFEAGFENIFDRIILVTADENLRLSRLMQRNNLSKKEAESRINSQLPDEIKKKKANYIITNNSSLSDLEKQTNLILSKLFG